MAATVAMNHGQGGWPMTVFLTPEQEPFFAGTYFPPDDRWGRPGFRHAAQERSRRLWNKIGRRRSQAQEMTERLKGESQTPPPFPFSAECSTRSSHNFSEDFDARIWRIRQRAPKFPPAAAYPCSCVVTVGRRCATLHDGHARRSIRWRRAGIYDHIGGGFARYSTDERWLVPHFEKMLYDNALLAEPIWRPTKSPSGNHIGIL